MYLSTPTPKSYGLLIAEYSKTILHPFSFYSCEGAALEVLMYVCLPVRPSVHPSVPKLNFQGRFLRFPEVLGKVQERFKEVLGNVQGSFA